MTSPTEVISVDVDPSKATFRRQSVPSAIEVSLKDASGDLVRISFFFFSGLVLLLNELYTGVGKSRLSSTYHTGPVQSKGRSHLPMDVEHLMTAWLVKT